MKIDLRQLSNQINLKNLTLNKFVETLNIIGLEVDEIAFFQNEEEKNINEISLLLKVPANREDLMNENFLVKDLSFIFSFQQKKKWKNILYLYSDFRKNFYNESKNIKIFPIQNFSSEGEIYLFEFKNLKNHTSPKWLQQKLNNNGESFSNLQSDLPKLLFLEWGQDFKSLDFEKREKNLRLRLRALEKKEIFSPSAKEEYRLPKNSLILEDGTGKIISCLGYSSSFKHSQESNLVYFQLWFYDIHSNFLQINPLEYPFSLRFLRQSFSETVHKALQRFLTIIELISENKVTLKVFKSTNLITKKEKKKILAVRKSSAYSVLNLSEYNLDIFQKMGFDLVCQTKKKYYFQLPHRRKDITREIDIIEEYSRFIGYKNFPEILPYKKQIKTNKRSKELKNYFLTKGFDEVQTNPLREKNTRIGKKDDSITLVNPISTELRFLKNELVSSLLYVLETNSRIRSEQTKFFEICKTFQKKNRKFYEIEKIAGVFQLEKKQNEISWFLAKAEIENFLEATGYSINSLSIIPLKSSFFSFCHPTRSILFKYKEKSIGIFGQINPQQEKRINSKHITYFFEFDLLYFPNWKTKNKIQNYQDYSRYPSIIKDISFDFPLQTNFSELKIALITKLNQLNKISIFDIYCEDKEINVMKIGLRLEFQSQEKTLSKEEVEKEIEKATLIIQEKFAGNKAS